MARRRTELKLAPLCAALTALLTGACATPGAVTEPYRVPQPQGSPQRPAEVPAAATPPGPGSGPAIGQELSEASVALLEQSRAQRRDGNLGQASATLERAIRIEPKQALLWLELGRLRFAEGDYVQAEQLGRKAGSLATASSASADGSRQLVADALRAQGRQ